MEKRKHTAKRFSHPEVQARIAALRYRKDYIPSPKSLTLLMGTKIDPLLRIALEHICRQDELIAKLSKTPKAKTTRRDLAMGDIAIGLWLQDKELSIAQIAKKMGVKRTTPYKWKNFMALRKLQEEYNRELFLKSLPAGSKDGETGDEEAWEKKRRPSKWRLKDDD